MPFPLYFFFWLNLVAWALGRLVNLTIDDEHGDEVTGQKVIYSSDVWKQGNSCVACSARPDPSNAQDGTWHDGTYISSLEDRPLEFSFTFTGVAVYLFFIGDITTFTNVDIALDGQKVGSFNRPASPSGFEYNITAFASGSIPNQSHKIVVTSTGPDDDIILFDYAIYSTMETLKEAPPPPPPIHASDVQQTASSSSSSSSEQPSPSLSPSPTASSPTESPTRSLSSTQSFSSSPSSPSQSFPQISIIPQPSLTASPSDQDQNASAGISANDDNRHVNVGEVVGGATGGVGLVALILILMWILRRRRDRGTRTSPFTFTSGKPLGSVDSLALCGSSAGANGSTIVFRLDEIKSEPETDDDHITVLHRQLQAFRSEFERLRARSVRSSLATVGGGASVTTLPRRRETLSRAVTTLANEMTRWREDMTELRLQESEQRNSQNHYPPVQGLILDEMQRELQMLRAEIEDLRSCAQLEPLPGYSSSTNVVPRPLEIVDTPPRALPIPSSLSGVVFADNQSTC
ncbi:hypothetical protein BXZ70DRAFT_1006616 [Cristinia sonorae]|uniref:Uncharacterized protein n=1 Tax=Cristinia sonorae TaxID=1940300 RepID=A0A8K0UUC5_9AGAR|nr:hypothetical protein BXZ70DRAFT_1006616 [Cristinia sonorae]